MAQPCPPSYPILCPNGTCGASQDDCARSGTTPAGAGGQDTGNQPGLPAYQKPPGNCSALGVTWCQSNTGASFPWTSANCPGTSTPLPSNAQDCPEPIRGLSDFLNRLWNRALGNPSFWKFTGLIGAGVLAVIIGGIIFMKE